MSLINIPDPSVTALDPPRVRMGQRSAQVTPQVPLHGWSGLRRSLSGGRIDGRRSNSVDKRRRIYGADRWVMDPDCDHGTA